MERILKALLKPCISGPLLILLDSSDFNNGNVEFVAVVTDLFLSFIKASLGCTSLRSQNGA